MDLSNRTYTKIKEKLVTCKYAPGSILNEAKLAKELNSSRTPVREAIKILQNEGFVTVIPKKGILVTDISLKTIREIFQVRIEIEPLVIKLGAQDIVKDKETLIKYKKILENADENTNFFQLDQDMHMNFICKCNNTYIIDMMKKIYDINARIVITSKENIAHIHEAKLDHIKILQTLLNEDIELSMNLMREHIDSCYKNALDSFYNI